MPPPVCNTSNIRNLRNEVSFNDAERSEATQLAKDVVKTFFSREMLTSYDEL